MNYALLLFTALLPVTGFADAVGTVAPVRVQFQSELQQPQAPQITLNGTWTRVADTCEPLSDETVKNLAKTGGGNGLVRSMVLSFEGDSFAANVLPSPRCDKNFKPSGLQSDLGAAHCNDSVNERTFKRMGGSGLFLQTKKRGSGNPWGITYRYWDYEIKDGVLIMTTRHGPCKNDYFHIYFLQAGAV